MTSSGFRPPQFSEDVAWVPSWLQPHHEIQLDDHIMDAQTPYMQSCKVQGNPVFEKDVNLCAREDAGCNNFHLLLSGTDNSPLGMTPSGNLLHFHLHLSSNGMSQYTPSPVLTAPQPERGESNDVPSMQLLPETSAWPQEKTGPYGTEVDNGMPNAQVVSKSGMSQRPRSPSVSRDGKIGRKKHRENVDYKNLLNADVTNAIELSIAASEALAVSDIVNSGSSSEVLSASAVIEVALRVKQARDRLCPVTLGNISNCNAEMVDETDLLQDLDEDIMDDAYEDVGLCTKPEDTMHEDPCSKSVPDYKCSLSGTLSRVLDTPVSQIHYKCDVEVQNTKTRSQEVEFDGTLNTKSEDVLPLDSKSKDSPSESLLCLQQEKLSGDPRLVLDTRDAEVHLDAEFNPSVQATAKSATYLEMNNGSDNESLSHTQQSILASPQIPKSKNDEAKDELFCASPDKFRSRWLGDWNGKDANDTAHMDQDTFKRITKFVIRETSFISESANLVQDANSLAKTPEVVPVVASLSSVAFEGVCSTRKGIELSQDLMSSYNLSVSDPLCSVVPCSISSDDANINVTTNQKEKEEDTYKCLAPDLESGLEDLQLRTTESGNGEGNILKTYHEESMATTRRQFSSLKSYSKLAPPREADPERNSYCTRGIPNVGFSEFHTFEDNIECFKSSRRKGCISYSKATPKSTSVTSAGEDHETLVAGMQMNESTNHKEHNDVNANDEAQLQAHHCENRSSPLVLNHRARRRLQASKIVLSNDITLGNVDTSSVAKDLEIRNQFCFNDEIMVAPLPPLCPSLPDPGETIRPIRKRVRFLEADTIGYKQEAASGYRTRSNTRSAKRLKKSISPSASRTQEKKTTLASSRTRDRKRMIFQGLEFLLTGFSSKKECELEMMIRKHGGYVVSDVPPPSSLGRNKRFRRKLHQLPVMLAPRKLETFKFLYGCAINAFILNTSWLTDSIISACLLPPDKYMMLPHQTAHKRIGRPIHCGDISYIFDNIGIMLHGKHSFCSEIGKLIKVGGGQVYKTLQWLVQSLKNGKISVGVIVTEDESSVSRHLRQCALEQNLAMMPGNWIVESLLIRKLVPCFRLDTNNNGDNGEFPCGMILSEEI